LRQQRVPTPDRDARVRKQTEVVGVLGFERRYPHELSGGMRQRAARARGFVADPKSLRMDEPFAALDAQIRSLMQQEVLAVWQCNQRSVIFITHNIEEAIFLGDRTVVMTPRPAASER
jgi:NitT/TauT family transport system ATP-binding protein